MFHTIVEKQSFIPLRERSFKATSSFQVSLVSKLNIAVDPIKINMIVVAYLLVGSSLILEGVEERIPMHVDVRLLSEESLTISAEFVKETCVVVVLHHHLLLFELVLIILEFLDPLEGRLPDRYILC